MSKHDQDPTDESRAAGESGIAPLARELVRLAQNDPEQLMRRVAALTIREQAELALQLPSKQRMELMLHAPKPMRLVRALPDLDLYLTVRDLGPGEALPLLALASASQITHLIDLESWRKDRFDGDRAGAWAAVLLEAGEPALRRFLRAADDELLAMLLSKWVRVELIESDEPVEIGGHGSSEAGDELGPVTPDGFFRFSPSIPEHRPAIARLLRMMFREQPKRYEQALWSAMWELPGELEERALQWRQARLEEHGFPNWEDALSVYAPPAGRLAHPAPLTPLDPDGLAAPRSPLRLRGPEDSLRAAIDDLPAGRRERVLHEVVSLANRLLVADGADTGDPDAHRNALDKAIGYLNVATRARGARDSASIGRLLTEVPALDLFQEGYGRAVELQLRARQLREQGWAASGPRALGLLDRPIMERVAGLLETRPLYVELDDEDEHTLRHFRSLAEVEETRVAVEMAELYGRLLLDRFGLGPAELPADGPRDDGPVRKFSNRFLTLLAWNSTRDELRGDPLPAEVASDFLRNVASRRTAGPDAPQRALDALVQKLATAESLTPREVSMFQSFGRFCLERLAEQCSNLDPGVPPDPRSVSCLALIG